MPTEQALTVARQLREQQKAKAASAKSVPTLQNITPVIKVASAPSPTRSRRQELYNQMNAAVKQRALEKKAPATTVSLDQAAEAYRQTVRGPRIFKGGKQIIETSAGAAKIQSEKEKAAAAIPPYRTIDKIQDAVQQPVKSFLSVVGAVSNAASAGATAILNPVASLITAASTREGSFKDRYSEAFRIGMEAAGKRAEGQSLLRTSGITDAMRGQDPSFLRRIGSGAAEFAFDVLTDPTSFIGGSAAAKTITAGGEVLKFSQKGSRLVDDLAKVNFDSAVKAAKDASTKLDTIAMAELRTKAVRDAALTIAKTASPENAVMFERGIRYLGNADKVILPTGKAIDGAMARVHSVASFINERTPGVQAVKNAFVKGLLPLKDRLGARFTETVEKMDMIESVASAKKNALLVDARSNFKSLEANYDPFIRGAKSMDEALQRAAKDIGIDGKISDGEQFIAQYDRGGRYFALLREEAKSVAQKYYDEFDAQKLGIVDTGMAKNIKLLDNYAPITYKNAIRADVAKKVKDVIAKWKTGNANEIEAEFAKRVSQDQVLKKAAENGTIDTLPFWALDRVFSSPVEAFAVAGLKPRGFSASAIERIYSGETTIGVQKLINSFAEQGSEPLKKLNAAAKMTPEERATTTVQYFDRATGREYELPVNVYEQIETIKNLQPERLGVNLPAPARKALEAFDEVTRLHKTWVTAIFPSFYARNDFSSMVVIFMAEGARAAFRPDIMQVAAMVGSKKLAEKNASKVVRLGQFEYTVGELRELVEKTGALQIQTTAEGINNAVVRKARAFYGADGREGFLRTVPFLFELERTGSAKVAADYAGKLLVDYRRLTPFERSVMTRLFPFYTFSRRNINAQMYLLKNKPMSLARFERFRQSLGDGEQENRPAPGYATRGFSQYLESKNGYDFYLAELGVPIEQFNAMTTLTMDQAGSTYLGSLNPMIKAAVEVPTRYSFFTGNKIRESDARTQIAALRLLNQIPGMGVNFTEEKAKNGKFRYNANPAWISIVQNLPTARLTALLSSMMNKNKTSSEEGRKGIANSLLTGVKIYQVDPDLESYYQTKEGLEAKREIYLQMGVIKRGKTGSYYVDSQSIFDPNNETADAQLKIEAAKVLKDLGQLKVGDNY